MAFDFSRWPNADALLDEALALPPDERRAFVRRATDDTGLRRALEHVLAEADPASDAFLPPAGALSGPLARLLQDDPGGDAEPRLAPGDTIGGYEVVGHLGRGGMGEVYRARDASLGRDVALKILPAEVAADPTRLARFRREARLLASLNHPNIGAIYHVVDEKGVLALVLELVDGPTLAERLAIGPLALDETITIARQIGDAIAAAHQAGVVHRDLKPANIKVTPAGVVKVLDFGIAKALGGDDTGETDLHATITDRAGVAAIGTAAYMSPEQARGEKVDHRTDVWAFACVVYEMLTGRRAFEGQSTTEVLARVLERDPDFDRLPAPTPEPIRRLLRRAFQKDSQHRLGYIGDALLEIEDAAGVASAEAPSGHGPGRRARGWMLVAAGTAAGAVAAALLSAPRDREPAPELRVAIPVPADHDVVVGQLPALALSRDGRAIVYRARQGGVMRLFRRSLDAADASPLRNTEDAAGHALSPDGQHVVFVRDGQIYKMALDGSTPTAIGTVAGGAALSWGAQDTIVYAGGPGNTLKRLGAAGGQAEAITTIDQARGEIAHNWPELLPDGRTVLFTVTGVDGHQVAVTTLGSGDPPVLVTAGRQPHLLPSGVLVFARDRGLWSARFDPATRRLLSEPQPALDGIDRSGLNGFVHFAVADNGTLAFVPFRERAGLRLLQWVDRAGQVAGTALVERRGITRFALSPDESRVAIAIADGDERDIWVLDRQRGATTRLTTDRGTETQPVWSPDSRLIAYRADHDGGGIFIRTADGASPARRLTMAGDAVDIPYAFTADGRRVLFTRFRDYTDQDVMAVPVDGGETAPVLAERHAEMRPALSPDGRWLLYQSDESGRLEVYLRPFPGVGDGRWPVSVNGGTSAAWRADGAELYFVEGTTLQAVSFTGAVAPRLGRPRRLVDLGPSDDRLGQEFEVSSDGTRVLVVRDAPGSAERPEVRLVLNWTGGR